MSDLDDDFLALAEGRNLGKAKPSKSKRKRSPQPDESAESDMSMSDSDSELPPARKTKRPATGPSSTGGPALYPLEGKYKDNRDREYLLSLNELEREAILGERADEMNQARERAELSRMVKAKDRAAAGGGADSDEEDDDSDDEYGAGGRARSRKTTGATSEKREGLEKLKRSRAQKGAQKTKRDEDSYDPRRKGGHSDDGYGYSDPDSSEEGEVESYGQRLSGKADKKASESASLDELRAVVLPRSRLAKLCLAPWFKDWLVGGWVRYSVGPDREGVPQYRLCEVVDVRDVPGRPYRFEGVSTTLQLKVEHGKSARVVTMEGVSDSPPTDREIIRVQSQLQADKIPPMTSKEAGKLKARLDDKHEYIMTEADLSALLARKGAAAVNPAQGKAKLLIQRDFARNSGNAELLAEVEQQLAQLESTRNAADLAEQERARKLNERNRATNREEIKKAESRAQEARRLQAQALARGDLNVKVDPSARVKTMTRLTYDREGSGTPSRPSTPAPAAAPTASSSAAAGAVESRPKAATKLEDMVANRVQVDVDFDF